ncbi:tetratricopeptide repeat protein [Flavobacterium franklandianum]|uniref:tetratricopeptide repeat protein n=1 Tax=Flavobacterium franklandianum TaxID=2594430 RepID=UPI00117A29CE|nr:tetratricopeptide repeat protein [Flavobacterium franklandianum]TRX27935.1 tetratricopeptide repeat protein [Flavobacterium franklandianum]
MKKIIFIFLLSTQFFFAQDGFEKGNDFYRKGKYEQAITEYESVLAGKQHSAELYFNLGNCYYKLNKVAPAIYNYEKALVLNPNDAEITNNLKFAHKMQIDEIKVVPQVGFSKMVHDFTSVFHYNTWAGISVGLAILFLVFFIGYYFSQTVLSKRIFFIGMFVFLFLILISVSSAISEKNHFENDKPAIVFAEMVLVKSEPQGASTTVFTLHEGTKVFVLETLDSWKKIQLTDGTEGWIEKTAIKEVK